MREGLGGHHTSTKIENIRDPKLMYMVTEQHLGHNTYISAQANHTYLKCVDCKMWNGGDFTMLKTYNDGRQNPIMFYIKEKEVYITGVER